MQQLLTILHILIAVCVVLLVLIQRGKGSDMGAGFGSGASGTMFGSQGATPFLVKLTAGLAILFFVSSSLLSFVVGRQAAQSQELPFLNAPMKTVEPIPVSSALQTDQSLKPNLPASQTTLAPKQKSTAATLKK